VAAQLRQRHAENRFRAAAISGEQRQNINLSIAVPCGRVITGRSESGWDVGTLTIANFTFSGRRVGAAWEMGILWLMKSEKRLLKILMDSIQPEIGKSLLKNSASLQSHRPSCLQPIRSAIARIIERKGSRISRSRAGGYTLELQALFGVEPRHRNHGRLPSCSGVMDAMNDIKGLTPHGSCERDWCQWRQSRGVLRTFVAISL
jgi:hypothetical protein